MIDLAELTLERVVERIGSTYYGKYRGLVSDVSDPENRCRIKATLPGLLDGAQCGWAMPVLPFAGDGHGMVKLVHSGGAEIVLSGDGITISFQACKLEISGTDISLNNGLIKVGLAGVSLVNGAMAFGVPP
jgi:hypothetical protein